MKKEDFKVGQTVWLYLIGNAARGKNTDEERIEEWEVYSIGRKYIQVKKKNWSSIKIKFDMTDNFRQWNNGYSPDYELYPTEEELLKSLWKRMVKREIQTSMYTSKTLDKLNDEELETIYGILILKKYMDD